MHSIEKRIAALEAAGNAAAFRCIRLQLGETEQEARRRCNVPDDVTDILFIRRVIISPSSLPPNPLNQAQPAPLPNNEQIPQTIQLTEPAPPEQDYIEHETRFNDNDQQASDWNYETGQYRGGKPMQKMSNSQVAKNSVNLLLKNISNRTEINRHLLL